MTTPGGGSGLPSPAVLSVTADLDITVDGHSAHLEGHRQHLVLRSDVPHLMWSSLTQASLPDEVGNLSGLRSVGRAAQAMADMGVHLDIEGPRGTVISLGHGEHSVIGRLVTGNSAVRPGSVRTLVPFVEVVAKRVLRRG